MQNTALFNDTIFPCVKLSSRQRCMKFSNNQDYFKHTQSTAVSPMPDHFLLSKFQFSWITHLYLMIPSLGTCNCLMENPFDHSALLQPDSTPWTLHLQHLCNYMTDFSNNVSSIMEQVEVGLEVIWFE